MNREILFRGKHIRNDIWVTGHYVEIKNEFQHNYLIVLSDAGIDKNDFQLMDDIIGFVDIEIETLGQYTGLKDKNGKKIFEGDIVRAKDSFFYNDGYYKIVYIKGGFIAEDKNESEKVTFGKDLSLDDFEVVGNIHDNLELLKGDIKW